MSAAPQRQRAGAAPQKHVLAAEEIDAAIFDLDRVVTRTARVHAAAWRRLFGDFLRTHAERKGEPFRPFEIATDYPHYVDGMPRFEGVESFLESRAIVLPWGEPGDAEDKETIYGLGNRKNRYFREHLAREGVETFESSVRFLRALREAGIKTGLVSSSRKAAAVVDAAGLADLFDARIDGNNLALLGLKGKPAPDLFLLAAERLGARPERAIVFEDTISGMEAGRAGRFSHVIGLDRRDAPEMLRQAGADIVIPDLAFLKVEGRRLARSEDPT